MDSSVSLAQKTVIAYYDPFKVYEDLKEELHNNVPLTNLHWNHPLRPLRSIATLGVEFIEENAQSEALPKHQMLGLSSTPLFKVIFIKCDDNDTYRSTVRPIIREWLTNSVNGLRDPTEWLIVHYVPPGSKAYSGNRFKYGVLDKIKVDFNNGSKHDRSIQLKSDYATPMDKAEAWKFFVTKIKDGILEAFSNRVDLYQAEITKLEAKKHVLGWNFGKFFVMKEGLALAFEKMNLLEDALLLYDELENAFIQLSRQKAVSFFSSVGFETMPPSLLDIQKESQMRHNLLTNTISLFDFHCYLFGRQAFLLLCIAENAATPSISALKTGELFLRLRSFITEVNSLLVSNKQNLQAVAEWTFNVSQEFQQACGWVDGGLVREVPEGRGELHLLIRKSLEVIAATRGWYIEGVLTEVSLDDASSETIAPDYVVANKNLASYLTSCDSFYKNYRKITEAALAEFDLADRTRTKNRLSSQLALLEYQLGNFRAAADLLESIPGLYNRQGWNLVSTSLLLVYVECVKKLNRHDLVLANSLDLLSRCEYLTKDQVSDHISNVQTLADSVSFSASFDNYFECTVEPLVHAVEGTDSYCLNVTFKSPFKQDFKFDSAKLTVRNLKDTTDTLSFEVSKSAPIILDGRETTFTFETPKLTRANFKVTGLVFTRGRVVFTKSFTDTSPVLIQLYPSPQNFHAKFVVPPELDLGERRMGLLLHSGQNQIQSGKILLKSMTPGMKLMSMKASNDKTINSEVKIATVDGKPPSITFDSLSPSTDVIVTVPYVIEQDLSHIRVKAFIDYTTENDKTYSYVIDQNLDISLALSVNVQDFYKQDKLFSKFTMSCTGEEPVRVISANIPDTSDFRISSPYGTNTGHVRCLFFFFPISPF